MCTECVLSDNVLFLFNSLLTVSRYIDIAFADKGSHKKKLTTKIFGHILVQIIREAYKKSRIESIILSHLRSMQKFKYQKYTFKKKNLTPPALDCLYLGLSISVFTNFFFAYSLIDSSIILAPFRTKFTKKKFLKMIFL